MKQTILSSQCDFGVNGMTMGTIVEDRELRQKRFVFRDRADAGRQLLRLMGTHRGKNTIVLAIPSGGLPVAAEIAKGLDVPLDVVIVRKLQIPRNKEAGFGAISLEGDKVLNDELVADLDLSDDQMETAKEDAIREGRSRQRALRGDRPPPDLTGRVVILVDDGLASGYTMLAAVKAVRAGNPSKIVVAVPTGSDRSVDLISKAADEVVCLNIRSMPFAVADAFVKWYDVEEAEAVQIMRYGRHR